MEAGAAAVIVGIVERRRLSLAAEVPGTLGVAGGLVPVGGGIVAADLHGQTDTVWQTAAGAARRPSAGDPKTPGSCYAAAAALMAQQGAFIPATGIARSPGGEDGASIDPAHQATCPI